MTATTYSEVWNLDVFFKGGSDSSELQEHLTQTENQIKHFETKVTTGHRLIHLRIPITCKNYLPI